MNVMLVSFDWAAVLSISQIDTSGSNSCYTEDIIGDGDTDHDNEFTEGEVGVDEVVEEVFDSDELDDEENCPSEFESKIDPSR